MPAPKDPIKYIEFCKRISKATKEGRCGMKGRQHSDETKLKIGLANSISLLGNIVSEETKRKISKKMKNRIVSDEMRENCRKSALKQFKDGMPEKSKIKLKKYKGELASGW